LGQNWLGEAAWRCLRSEECETLEVVAVCSNPSSQTVWWRSNQVFETCGNIPFIDNSHRNDQILVDSIKRYKVDTILCVQHSWVLSADVLAAVNYNALNFHNAKLPKYRGYNAVNHAILNRDEQFTCTVHWMADKVDQGDIAYEAVSSISCDETALSLYAKCYHAGLRLFDKVLSDLGNLRSIPHRPMMGQERFYSRHSIDNLREIKDIYELDVKSRAFYLPPFEPAFVLMNGRKVYVLPETLFNLGFKVGSLDILAQAIRATGREFQCALR
jgi:methionyl-tRNA formyltransferase